MGKNKVAKRDVMTELYNHLRDKKLKTTTQTQQSEILQTYLSPESEDRIIDPGGGRGADKAFGFVLGFLVFCELMFLVGWTDIFRVFMDSVFWVSVFTCYLLLFFW